MVVDRSSQMTNTRGSWLVGSHDGRAWSWLLDDLDDCFIGDAIFRRVGLLAGDGCSSSKGCVISGGRLSEGECLKAPAQRRELEPWLEHGCQCPGRVFSRVDGYE